MASEYVTRIHLFDSLYQQKWDSIDVNMNLDLPTYIDDDRPQCPYVYSFELKGRSVNHLRQVEAQYAFITPALGVQRTGLSWLLAPPQMGLSIAGIGHIPGYGSVPTWNIYTPPPPPHTQIQYVSSTPHGLYSWTGVDDTPYGQLTEPECHCDMRMLMSQEHPAGCPWMVWKKSQKRLEKISVGGIAND